MNTKAVLISIGLVFLLSGCSATAATQTHPDYSIFRDVPKSKLKAIKDVVKTEDIMNLKFPTEMPFKVTEANMPTPATDPLRKHHMDYVIGSKQGSLIRFLEVSADTDKQASVDPNNLKVATNQVVTKLGDGTKAVFGNNGAVTQLAWIKDDVLYVIASGKGTATSQSEPDLTENQLIHVADSFN